MIKYLTVWIAIGLAFKGSLPAANDDLRLPEGFEAETLVTGINAATALTVAPDGRVFYAEQTGAVRVVVSDALVPQPAIDLGDRLDTWWERGLIGMTLHPDFPHTPYAYLVYVAKDPHTHHVVSRFTVVGDRFDPGSELVLLRGDDQATLGGHVPAGHQGGPICFGADGMLYIGIGEQTAGQPSQSLESLQGKILRIRQDGFIPEDNPFYDEAEGKYRAIHATGIRNPFGLAADPASGRLFETDVGASAFEEINVIEAGGNYGWPEVEGPGEDGKFINPLHAYPPAIGRSICGALFYPREGNFPERWRGKFFFADWASHWIKALDPEQPETLIPFADGLEAPVGLAAGIEGDLYVLNRNTRWRDGDQFEENSGSLVRIRYAGESARPPSTPRPAANLTETGYFANPVELQVREEFHPFEVNVPVWLPGVVRRQWISIPEGAAIEGGAEGPWHLPSDAVVIQHHDTVEGRPHETHIYGSQGDGMYRAAAYRWDGESGSARLVTHSEMVTLPGSGELKWFSPGPEPALRPEVSPVGFLLQLNARQLHAGNQLERWRNRGWLRPDLTEEELGAWPRLAPLEEVSASLEARVRSYLDANCAVCHRPGGPSRGFFDARFTTPLASQNLILGELMAGDLGLRGARVLVPGSPERSMLWQRLTRHDAFRMPPVAVNAVTSPVVPLMERWIREMPQPVTLMRDAVDASAGGLAAFKIVTPMATYYLEKSGAGLSSLIDRDGQDWLGFHPEEGSGAGGEYRGFPNAVHQQGGNHFHARNSATDPARATVVREGPEEVVIEAESVDGLWAARYVFTPSHATFTMIRMPPDRRYWVLYEGVPGGEVDDHDWWMTSANPEKRALSVDHEGDIPAPEWIAFGDGDRERALFVYHHEDDAHPDRFYQMERKMTVFGFGRDGLHKFLDSVPQSVSIGLVESDDHGAIGRAVTKVMER